MRSPTRSALREGRVCQGDKGGELEGKNKRIWSSDLRRRLARNAGMVLPETSWPVHSQRTDLGNTKGGEKSSWLRALRNPSLSHPSSNKLTSPRAQHCYILASVDPLHPLRARSRPIVRADLSHNPVTIQILLQSNLCDELQCKRWCVASLFACEMKKFVWLEAVLPA